MYCRSISAEFLSGGASKAWFNGNPASPGIAKLVSRAEFITACFAGLASASSSPENQKTTHLLSLSPGHARLDLAQYVAHIEDAIDEHAIGWSLDLEIAEECVGTEESQDFI